MGVIISPLTPHVNELLLHQRSSPRRSLLTDRLGPRRMLRCSSGQWLHIGSNFAQVVDGSSLRSLVVRRFWQEASVQGPGGI